MKNSTRPVTLDRDNWLRVGSAKPGPKIATILSVVESCRRLRVPVKDDLLSVLPSMSGTKHFEVTQLTPFAGRRSREDSR